MRAGLAPPLPAPAGSDAAEDGRQPGLDPNWEYPVELERLRARMPDNLYWRLGAPTSDPALLAEREQHRRRMRQAKGRITAGMTSEEEIRAYFDEQRRISEDFLALAQAVLAEHGGELSDRDRGLYELTARLHAARLAEMDRRLEEALERKRVQDRRRAEWRGAGSPVPWAPP